MKTPFIALAAGASALLLAGCGATGSEVGTTEGDITTLTVGASAVPHGQILEFIDENLAADAGLDLEIVTYDDYTMPNRALSDGDLDANYFQHMPYLQSEAEAQGYEMYAFEPGMHIEPFALYSEKHASIDELPDGAQIGINNDPANQGRALTLLQHEGLITLAEDVDPVTATIHDVAENPKNLQFIEADAGMLAQTLADTDASVINGNNAMEAGLSATKDSLAVESPEGNPYQNILVVRSGDETNEAILALNDLTHSEEVRDYITQTWPDGEVIPAF